MICFLIYWSDKIKRAKGESQSALIVQGYSLISITEYHIFCYYIRKITKHLPQIQIFSFLLFCNLMSQMSNNTMFKYHRCLNHQAANIQGLKIRVGKECFISYFISLNYPAKKNTYYSEKPYLFNCNRSIGIERFASWSQ